LCSSLNYWQTDIHSPNFSTDCWCFSLWWWLSSGQLQ
jgi:hypothetical protein